MKNKAKREQIAIFILHGWGEETQQWKQVAEKLKIYYPHTYLIPIPGFDIEFPHSNSPRYTPWGISQYSAYAEKFIQQKLKNTQAKRIVLIGHSFGGKIATKVSISKKIHIDNLIISASPLIPSRTNKTRAKILFYKGIKNILGLIPIKGKYLQQKWRDKNVSKDATASNTVSADIISKVFYKVVGFTFTPQELNQTPSSTHIIWGEEDKIVQIKLGRKIHKIIRQSQFYRVPKANHFWYQKNPNLFFGLVHKILSQS